LRAAHQRKQVYGNAVPSSKKVKLQQAPLLSPSELQALQPGLGWNTYNASRWAHSPC
jgi:hypothetical protein